MRWPWYWFRAWKVCYEFFKFLCWFHISGFKYQKMSSPVMGKTEKNVAVKDYSQELPLANCYETAMEALSSLITRQKRGTPSSIIPKYGKLDRMQMYLKVLLYHSSSSLQRVYKQGSNNFLFCTIQSMLLCFLQYYDYLFPFSVGWIIMLH